MLKIVCIHQFHIKAQYNILMRKYQVKLNRSIWIQIYIVYKFCMQHGESVHCL